VVTIKFWQDKWVGSAPLCDIFFRDSLKYLLNRDLHLKKWVLGKGIIGIGNLLGEETFLVGRKNYIDTFLRSLGRLQFQRRRTSVCVFGGMYMVRDN
jgi:hypothetical protein